MKHAADIDPLALRCLVATVRERSVTRAAEALGMGQPALSHVLARLRQRFGDPLLVRSSQGMAPTPRALQLAQTAADVLDGMDRLHASRDAFDPAREEARFVVTVTDYFERLLAPPLMRRLQSEAPNVCVEWRSPNPLLVHAWLESGEVDLRVAWVHAPWPGLRFSRLFSDRLVCLAREGHPGVGRKLTLAQFLAAAHVRPTIAVSGIRNGRWPARLTLEQYLGLSSSARGTADNLNMLRRTELRVAMLAQSFIGIPAVVAQSDLLATLPSLVLKGQALPAALRVLAPPLDLPPLHGALYWHERSNSDARHRWFRRLVASVARATMG